MLQLSWAGRLLLSAVLDTGSSVRTTVPMPTSNLISMRCRSLGQIAGPGRDRDPNLPNWLRHEIGVERSPKHFVRHAASLPFRASIVFPVSIAEPQVSARRCFFEDDLTALAREITSRHGVDKRPLLSLDARRTVGHSWSAVIIGPANVSPMFSFCENGRVASVCVESQLAMIITEGAALTSRSIPTGYGYDCFTRIVIESKRAGWGACGAEISHEFHYRCGWRINGGV